MYWGEDDVDRMVSESGGALADEIDSAFPDGDETFRVFLMFQSLLLLLLVLPLSAVVMRQGERCEGG